MTCLDIWDATLREHGFSDGMVEITHDFAAELDPEADSIMREEIPADKLESMRRIVAEEALKFLKTHYDPSKYLPPVL